MKRNTIFRIANECSSTHKQNLDVYQFYTEELVEFVDRISEMAVKLYKFDLLVDELMEPFPDNNSETRLFDYIKTENPELIEELKRLLQV